MFQTRPKPHACPLRRAGLALAVLAAPPSLAQEGGGEIVVTAQRRAQDVLEIGATIDTLGAQEIRDRRLQQVSDFVGQLANVDIKENSPGILPVITIRGVGLDDFSATNNPAAGVYVDEIYLSSLALLNAELFDVQRLEALKGPQGTLYGRNSTAGAINIISARPSFDGPSGRVMAGYGSYDTAEAEAVYNFVPSDALALRFSGRFVNQEEGFQFNAARGEDVGRRQVLAARAQALWTPTETVTALLKVEGQRGRSETAAGEFFGALPAPGATCPGEPGCFDFLGNRDTDGDPFRVRQSVDPTYDIDQWAVTLRADFVLDAVTLTSVTGYIDFERQWGADTDATARLQADFVERDDIEQVSQEFRLAGDLDRLSWLTGVFYSFDHVKGSYDGSLQDLLNTTTLSLWNQTSQSAALFGDATFELAEGVTLVGGLRYTYEEKNNTAATIDLVSRPPASFLSFQPFGAPAVPLAVVDATIDDRNWSWRAGVNWRVTEAALLYAQASQGVKSGGFFTGVATTNAQLRAYEPETLVAYEVGAKYRDDEFRANLAAFYYDYTDVQTFIRDESGGIPIARLGNVEDATVYGLDLDLAYLPDALPGLRLTGAVGVTQSELGPFRATAGPIPEGNDLPNAPNLTATLGASYDVTLSDTLGATLAGDARYVGEQFKDSLNSPLLATDSYWVLNAQATLVYDQDWEFAVWGKNLTDERYVTQGVNSLPLGFGYRVYGAPFTFGATLARSF